MATRSQIESRERRFLDLLSGKDGANVGTEISFEMFATATAELGQKPLAPRSCMNFLREMKLRNPKPYPGTELKVGAKSACLQRVKQHLVLDRGKDRPDVKEGLGSALWDVLFKAKLSNAKVEHRSGKYELNLHLNERAQAKLAALRRKSPVSMLIDAGSTTMKVVSQLIKHENLPFKVATDEGEKTIGLNITTNCPEIAVMLNNSRHAQDIGISLVGGDLRPDRGSICGATAQQWLRMWLGNDSTAGDVAVVGSTGIQYSSSGEIGFGSDNIEEAHLKSAFLSMVWLRVVVFDGSKLIVPPVSKGFATLSAADVDLVVTDGDLLESQKKTESFLELARQNMVATCVWSRRQ